MITSFNKGEFLRETIDSALAQDYAQQEILVVDDGSTDDTREISLSYGDKIKYIYQENQGQAAAKNKGVDLANGSLIAYLDGDDRWVPSKLTKQVRLLEENTNVGLVYCDKMIFTEEKVISKGDQLDRNRTFYRGNVLDQILVDNFVPFSGILVKRELLIEVGLMKPECRVAPDYDLLLRLARLYEFDYVNETLLEYRQSSNSIGGQIGSKLDPCMQIQNRFLDEFFDGKYPRPHVIKRATAEKYKVQGDFQLADGKNFQAFCSYFTALRNEPFTFKHYRSLVRSLIPNPVVSLLKRTNQ